jgi:hypothetical protein
MANEADEGVMDEVVEPVEAGEVVGDGVENAAPQAAEPVEQEPDEVVIAIDGVAPTPSEDDEPNATNFRRIRTAYREKSRELTDAKHQIEELKTKIAAPNPPSVNVQTDLAGQKPTLADCDYDQDEYAAKVEKWVSRKREAEEAEQAKQAEARKAQAAWQAKLDQYSKAKRELRVRDFEDAESAVEDILSVTQRGIIIHGAKEAAAGIIYALGKSPAKARELAAITDPVEFAFEIADLKKRLTVTPKKAAPPPEKTVRGSAPSTGAVDQTLERLRSDAMRTGDLTKVHQYQRAQRAKAA